MRMEISKYSLGLLWKDALTFLTRGSHHPAATAKSSTSLVSFYTADFGIAFCFLAAHLQDFSSYLFS